MKCSQIFIAQISSNGDFKDEKVRGPLAQFVWEGEGGGVDCPSLGLLLCGDYWFPSGLTRHVGDCLACMPV